MSETSEKMKNTIEIVNDDDVTDGFSVKAELNHSFDLNRRRHLCLIRRTLFRFTKLNAEVYIGLSYIKKKCILVYSFL